MDEQEMFVQSIYQLLRAVSHWTIQVRHKTGDMNILKSMLSTDLRTKSFPHVMLQWIS